MYNRFITKFPVEFQKQYYAGLEVKKLPFGKWEGKSLRYVFDCDRSYLQWLLQQPWFRTKFGNLFDTIVRMFQELGIRWDEY
jgi:uncharacterized protein (DUF3820 family)